MLTAAPNAPSVLGAVAQVADMVHRRADEVAVVDQQRSVTFGELGGMIDRRAAAVLDAVSGGVGASGDTADRWGAFVPVVVDRSVESVAAMLGMARAGVPMVPIDHAARPDDVREIVSRIGNPRVAVLARPEFASVLPSDVRGVLPEHRASGDVPFVEVRRDDPGLVIFTSGSTGRPKAVVRPWKAFDTVSPVVGFTREIGSHRLAMALPLNFSGGVNQLACLRFGHSLHIVDPGTMSALALLEWFASQGVTEIHGVTSMLLAVLRPAGGERRLPSLRCVSVGGETTEWGIVDMVRRVGSPDVSVISSLSSTETGPVMSWTIGPDQPLGEGRLPLGRVIDGVRVRLEEVDEPGGPGVLVSSDPIALGFLDDPELDARRFSVDEHGVRWFHSADLVQVGTDGLYRHVARVDEVVKINGRLVDPGTPQRVLRQLPGVAHAVVVPYRRSSGRTCLVGHVELSDRSLTPDDVMRSLRAGVAPHHLPAMLVLHDVLPLNDRGKVDRAALLVAPPVRWRSAPPTPMTGETERWVAGQIARIIDLDEFGADDDVWDAGLDSLGAVEFCAVVEAEGFGAITPPELLEHRTTVAIARRLASSSSSLVGAASPVVDLTGGDRGVAVFVIPGGGGTALAFRSLAQEVTSRVDPRQRMVVIEPRGLHSQGRAARSFERLTRDAEREIAQRLGPGEPCVVVGYSLGAVTAFELSRRRQAAGHEVRLVMLDGGPHTDESAALPPPAGAVVGPPAGMRGVALWRRRARVARYMVWPGRPRHDDARYRAFQRLVRDSVGAYRAPAEPVTFPVSLVSCGRHELEQRAVRIASDLRVVQIGGDHLSFLQPPYVGTVAQVVVDALASLDGGTGSEF